MPRHREKPWRDCFDDETVKNAKVVKRGSLVLWGALALLDTTLDDPGLHNEEGRLPRRLRKQRKARRKLEKNSRRKNRRHH